MKKKYQYGISGIFLTLLFCQSIFCEESGIEWKILNQEAADLYRAGKYQRAVVVAKKALEIAQETMGPDHPSVATSLNNIGELYNIQGQYAEAEPLHKRALAIREKALGPDHPDVGQSLSSLAKLYLNRIEHGSPDYLKMVTTLNNRAMLYNFRKKYDLAEPLFKHVLAIIEKAEGPDHPNAGATLNRLALLYQNQGQYDLAEPLYKRALAIREKALGPFHPDVAIILNNIGELYRIQGDLERAEPFFQRARKIKKDNILRRKKIDTVSE